MSNEEKRDISPLRSSSSPRSPNTAATLASSLGSVLSLRTSISRPPPLTTTPTPTAANPVPESPLSVGTPRRRNELSARSASRTPRSAAPARRSGRSNPATPTGPANASLLQALVGGGLFRDEGHAAAPAPVVAIPAVPAAAGARTSNNRDPAEMKQDDHAPLNQAFRGGNDALLPAGAGADEMKVVAIAGSEGAFVYKVASGGKLFRNLEKMYDSDFLADMEIIVNDVVIRAHQAVVVPQAKYFESFFANAEKFSPLHEGQRVRVHVSLKGNFEQRHIVEAINYLYTGKVVLKDSNVIDFFMISTELGIQGLKTFCEEHIGTAISPNSCLDLLESSKMHRSLELQKRCLQYFKQNADKIIRLYTNTSTTEQDVEKLRVLSALSEDTMIDILVKNFKCKEIEVLKFVLEWGMAQQSKNPSKSMSQIIANVAPFVRFVSLSRKQLEEFVVPLNVVPKKILIEVCFKKLNFQYSSPAGDEKMSEDRRAREPDGTPRKFYLRPRKKNWLTLEDFEHEGQYAEYCKSVLVPGMLMKAVHSYENVLEGDIGEFVQHNSGYPPCQINWQTYGSTYWLYWRDLEIVD